MNFQFSIANKKRYGRLVRLALVNFIANAPLAQTATQ
jgi:hypothetical protein